MCITENNVCEVQELLEWLGDNLIDDPEDVAFFLKEVAKLRKVFTEAKQEKEKNLLTNKESNKTKPWNQNDPFLCLGSTIVFLRTMSGTHS